MAQLYARVFVQILDSSIAEDFMVRHVFEDMFKVCDIDGIVDMTRPALSRRFVVPLTDLNRALEKLEAPDPHSRDPDFQGRRISRLDEHRDWGWRILNYEKYEGIRNRADVALRVARHRQRQRVEQAATESSGGVSAPPMQRVRGTNRPATLEEVVTYGAMIGVLPPACKKFWDHYQGTAKEDENGREVWVTGSEDNLKVVGNWKNVLSTWKSRDEERAHENKVNQRNRKEHQKEPGAPVVLKNLYTPPTPT